MNTFTFLLAINSAPQPALRIAFTIALFLTFCAGVFIYRRRGELFGRDPEVVNDTPVVRHCCRVGRADARGPERSLSTLVRLKNNMQPQITFETHGSAVTNAAIWFVMLNPVLVFIICAVAAWLMN
jgi:hypothetical protein